VQKYCFPIYLKYFGFFSTGGSLEIIPPNFRIKNGQINHARNPDYYREQLGSILDLEIVESKPNPHPKQIVRTLNSL